MFYLSWRKHVLYWRTSNIYKSEHISTWKCTHVVASVPVDIVYIYISHACRGDSEYCQSEYWNITRGSATSTLLGIYLIFFLLNRESLNIQLNTDSCCLLRSWSKNAWYMLKIVQSREVTVKIVNTELWVMRSDITRHLSTWKLFI